MKKLLGLFLTSCAILEVMIIGIYTDSWKTVFEFSFNSTDLTVTGAMRNQTVTYIPPWQTDFVTSRNNTDTKVTVVIQKPAELPKRRHVIINSYMRSGSSFFGNLLGFRPDTFYWFELFWKFTKWGFMKGSSEICDSRTCRSCGRSSQASQFTSVLTGFFNCDFTSLTSVLDQNSPQHSGALWRRTECSLTSIYPERCLKSVQPFCKSRKHLVTKILRTSLDNYRQFLSQHKDVMLIQLFRDPRAVINSRSLTGWYKFKNDQSLLEDAKCLCARMYQDYKYGLEFREKFPDRFMFVVYEDLLSDLHSKLNRLYQRFGMDTLEDLRNMSTEFQKLFAEYDVSDANKRKDYEFWWRYTVSWNHVQAIDSYCTDIYNAIGYKSFSNQKQYNDTTIPSVQVLDDLKIPV